MNAQSIEDTVQEGIEQCKREGNFAKGAEVAQSANFVEQARALYMKAAEKSESEGFLVDAGVYSVKASELEHAIDCFRKCGLYGSPSRLASAINDLPVVKQVYAAELTELEESRQFQQAAVLSLNIGDIENAKSYNLREPPWRDVSKKELTAGELAAYTLFSMGFYAVVITGLSVIFPPFGATLGIGNVIGYGIGMGTGKLLIHQIDSPHGPSTSKDPWRRFLYQQGRMDLYR